MQLSKNFTAQEMVCPCCGVAKMDMKFINTLQSLRDFFGKGLKINSGFRCVPHNDKIKGGKTSMHLKGQAVDIGTGTMTGVEKYQLIQHAMDIGFGGIGIAKSFVHIDNRSGPKVLWTY